MPSRSVSIALVVGLVLLVLGERSTALWYVAQAIRAGLLAVIIWESRALFRRGPHVLGILLVGVLFTACGGTSPMAPSPETSFLVGTWDGPITISRTGLPDTVGTSTWTFAPVQLTGGTTYTATVRVQDSWLPIDATLSTSLTGSLLVTSGTYRSPRKCDGSVASGGTAQPTRIEVSFNGIDCDQPPQTSVFTGHVVLTKR